MSWIHSLLIGSLLASAGLMAQSPTKPKSKPANDTQAASTSNEELNLRAYTELLRSDLRKSKSQVVGQVMQFDTDQAAIFWPIYKQFEADLSKVGDRTVSLVKKYTDNYEQMTNEVAEQMATEFLNIEQQRNDLKRRYYGKFKSALDAMTATRFLQVENQVERIVDLQIASQLPVMQASQGESR
ncbi:MAG: hypothetical protein ACJ746_01830 [Bryobacteraceae bacterium]